MAFETANDLLNADKIPDHRLPIMFCKKYVYGASKNQYFTFSEYKFSVNGLSICF